MIGQSAGSPQGLTKFPTLVDWQDPDWCLDCPMTHCNSAGSHVTTASPSNAVFYRGGKKREKEGERRGEGVSD